MSIVFLLLLSIWIGHQEIAYSFSGMHVSEILSLKRLRLMLPFAFILGLGAMMLLSEAPIEIVPCNVFDLTATLLLTCAIVNIMKLRSSVVMAYWGALIGFTAFHDKSVANVPWLLIALSGLILPLLGVCLTYIYRKWMERLVKHTTRHLLIRQNRLRRVAYAGIVLCAIALSFNYSVLFNSMLTSLQSAQPLRPWALMLLIAAVCLLCLFTTIRRVRRGFGETKKLNRALPALHSLITIIGGSAVACTLLATPVPIFSANQIKELNNLAYEPKRRSIRALNVFSITLITPTMAYIISTLMTAMEAYAVWKQTLTVLVLLLCALATLYIGQYNKHSMARHILSDERQHKAEIDKEMNRLDVVAVTSQFNVISDEIDLKQKELINLSLYISQQRALVEETCKQMTQELQRDELPEVRTAMMQRIGELRDSLKVTADLDYQYLQVDDMHKNFVSRLMMRCPTLTEREKRLAILLRLGFSSKEISSLMNIEIKSVETNRYRLRKKLRLDRNENIGTFLQLL